MATFSWDQIFRRFSDVVHRRQIATIAKFELVLELVSPAPDSAWQEPMELALAFSFMSTDDVATIMAPILHGFSMNFLREGSAEGSWPELKDLTQNERHALMTQGDMFGGTLVPGFTPAHPILQRTGDYRRSWVDPGHAKHVREDLGSGTASREIWEGSDHPYAEELSMGVPGRNLEPRPVHLVDQTFEEGMRARIDAMLTKYIQRVHPA